MASSLQRLIQNTVMIPLTVAAYGTVMIGLAWVTIAEAVSPTRRLAEPAPKERQIPPFGGPIQTL
jgi:hypothetical protein